ncbi:LytTR family transcriptional regulator DNA-binding domain-containing protein [Cohnella sp. REN36]|uniref:LytTR family transcriptional regulator DNA-binding domain-containing protein n=1 Tax=Cohnella sp. REN36 TaxID=2887347 RepID=UPI001D15BE21|nr:LytTR family transcriptional regulator DNA-binding domain-containing protein [Cohnella sp. REN36]MCC3376869.1 LytTR family transcriptional regulator DNA-binding domain-containing protein [Cohnella sp. REN36]
MWLSVTRDQEGKTGLLNVSIDDVLYLESDFEKWVRVHTRDEHFYIAGTLIYWTHAFQASGHAFQKVDRNIVVHEPKIKRLDPVFAMAYFDSEIGKHTKKITLAQKYFKELVRKAGQRELSIVIAAAT